MSSKEVGELLPSINSRDIRKKKRSPSVRRDQVKWQDMVGEAPITGTEDMGLVIARIDKLQASIESRLDIVLQALQEDSGKDDLGVLAGRLKRL